MKCIFRRKLTLEDKEMLYKLIWDKEMLYKLYWDKVIYCEKIQKFVYTNQCDCVWCDLYDPKCHLSLDE